MDRQTIYKEASEYYRIHSEILLKKGYVIIEDTKDYSVFVERVESRGNSPTPTVSTPIRI